MNNILRSITLFLMFLMLSLFNIGQDGFSSSFEPESAYFDSTNQCSKWSQSSFINLDQSDSWSPFAQHIEHKDDVDNLRDLLSTIPENPGSSANYSTPNLPGWRLDGAPVVWIKPYPKASCGYWGFYMSIDNFEAKGSQSWKDCSSQASRKCTGKYSGTVRWTKLPDFFAPGTKFRFDVSVSTIVSNVCGSRSIDSGIGVTFPGAPYLSVNERTARKGSRNVTIPTGKRNQKIRFEVVARTANLTGKVVYNYRYQ